MDVSLEDKKNFLLNFILQERKKQAIKIQSAFRAFKIEKKVWDIISKMKISYLIKSGIKEKDKKVQLKVFLNKKGKNKDIIIDLYFDDFFRQFICFVEYTILEQDTYKIQFISDGKVFIAPNFKTEEDEDGSFVNIIDLPFIKKTELSKEKEKKKKVKGYCKYLKKHNLTIVPNTTKDMDALNDTKKQYTELVDRFPSVGMDLKANDRKIKKIKSDGKIIKLFTSSKSINKLRNFSFSVNKRKKNKSILTTSKKYLEQLKSNDNIKEEEPTVNFGCVEYHRDF